MLALLAAVGPAVATSTIATSAAVNSAAAPDTAATPSAAVAGASDQARLPAEALPAGVSAAVPGALSTSQPDDFGRDAQAVADRLALDARGTGCTTSPDDTVSPERCSSVTTAAVKAPPRAAGDASAGFYRAEGAVSVGQMQSKDYACTATVVTSNSGNVAVTAAHCVYHPKTGPMARYFSTYGQDFDAFIPGRAGDDAPYGSWPITAAWVDSRWRESGDPAYDVAFIQLARQNGRSFQDVVGSQGISFTPPPAGTAVTALGYPAEPPFDGRSLRRCSTRAIAVAPTVNNALTMPCAMTPGFSGGPWMTGFNPATGAGTVVAVTSSHEENGPAWYAVPIGEFGYSLYQSADH
ncbi:trypsin-like serine peptidase [Pseudonocardia sulfidoxydans]